MAQVFDEVRFPAGISRGASGGPERKTEIVALASGSEERNSRWADSRRRYNAGFGVASLDDIYTVVAFYEERRGRLHGFRWKDHADFKSCRPAGTPDPLDQAIGTGTGSLKKFQLVKAYGSTIRPWVRTISKPVAGTVLVAVGGVLQTGASVDATTGLITLATPPPSGTLVTAGFQFDVPVRFDSDHLMVNLAHFGAGDIPDIPVLEIRV